MKRSAATIDETLLGLRHSLELMARWGCRGFECSPESLAILEQWSLPETRRSNAQPLVPGRCGPAQVSHIDARVSDASSADTAQASRVSPPEETLAQIRSDLGECRRCGLSSRRTHIVFGEGCPQADLVFVGEGPGHDEDISGVPFVGPAGQLLTRIIEAMKLDRERLYICNVVKCRPPDNRKPEPVEIEACTPFLKRQLAAIRPRVIVALGSTAAQILLGSTQSISRLRGRFHDVNGIKVMPTFHPSYLLRNPERKREVWEDMKKVMVLLRISL